LTASRRTATIDRDAAPDTEMKRRLALTLFLAPALAWVSPAAAHAVLLRAIPSADSAVHESPGKLRLSFSERLEPAFSTVEVLDGAGKRVDAGDSRVDSADAKLLQISLPHLPPGKYHVKWRVTSVDTHVSKGEYTFDITP
jgi:methionine-rich copper-binding protein CopC